MNHLQKVPLRKGQWKGKQILHLFSKYLLKKVAMKGK